MNCRLRKDAARRVLSPQKVQHEAGRAAKPYKLHDGDNLYIEIFQKGSKIWRFRFKFPKENVLSLGKYPKVSLAKAREERNKYLELLGKGIDQSIHRKVMKRVQTGQAENSFKMVGRAWLKE